jgi:DNA-binding MarR family transcriptional regulator
MSSVSTETRIALAWRELRRGASATALRSYLSGPGSSRLEQAQLDALEILAANRAGLAMSDFADSMRVDPSTATRAVDRLQRLGLAERVQHDADRRYVLARATPEGIRTIRRIARLRALGIQRLLESFDDDEREQFATYLERFVDSMDQLVAELDERANRTGVGEA